MQYVATLYTEETMVNYSKLEVVFHGACSLERLLW